MKQWQVLKTVFPEVITDNFEFTGDEESECMPMSAAALTRMLRYRRATADESKKREPHFRDTLFCVVPPATENRFV